MLAANDMQTNIGFKVYAVIPDDDDDDDTNNAVLLSTMKQCIKKKKQSILKYMHLILHWRKSSQHVSFVEGICSLGEGHDKWRNRERKCERTCLLLKKEKKKSPATLVKLKPL